ncbi:Hamartin protein-domain-containing protein [Tuber brumale]|nr:Hamartin protein-domain-containing protein [Tuber brumale]
MSGGSLKDLSKTLNVALSAPLPLYPLPDDVLNVIHAYLNKHINSDDHDSQRLHDELLNLHESKVRNRPENHATFLACFRALRPGLVGVERLLKWWDILVRPTLDSMGQAKVVVADARAIVLSVLAYDDEDDPTGEKAKGSAVFTDKLFEVFLEKTKLISSDRGAGFKEEQRQRFVSANVEAVLLAFGKRKPKVFLEKIDSFVVQKEYRLQVLGLLCSFVRLQGPHLYQILQTELLDHLLQCLENDTSTTVISLALTVLIMFMPHLCNSLASYLPRLFVVYTRVLCWDKFGVVRLEETKFAGHKDNYSRTNAPLPQAKGESCNSPWQKLDSSFETATSTTPDVSDYFTFLYGLYPLNLMAFIREPYKFLERAKYKDVDHLDIDEETIRQRTETYRQRHTLHPNFLNLTAETELSDQSRWMKVEPADVTAECIGLVNSSIPMGPAHDPRAKGAVPTATTKPELPEALVPTEDIPNESLLSSEAVDDDHASNSDASAQSWRGDTPAIYPNNNYPEVLGLFSRPPVGYGAHSRGSPYTIPRDSKTPDSPTIPHTMAPCEEEERLQDMIRLQENLRANLHESMKTDSTHSLPPLPGPPPSGPPPGYGSVTASPRLDAYVHSLSQNTVPRSPALRPAASDTQGTIAFLQREVMLLKNDLNFERYLKQQHLSHIGHLQRKHIKEATAEAETQNLINTNKTLKAKLEEAKKAYTISKQEALKSKSQAKKWEAELNLKIRSLREEQRAWKRDEESTKQALQAAREEADHLRKLLAENEAEGLRSRQKLQSISSEMEEVSKLRALVDHLSSKLAQHESHSEEIEMRKQSEEAALAHAERIRMRLQSREQEAQDMKRGYENKIQELESRISSLSGPLPAAPGQGFQEMIDNALSATNARFSSLRNEHNQLLSRYYNLKIKCIKLQADQELSNLPPHHSSLEHHQTSPMSQGFNDLHSSLALSDSEGSRCHSPRGGNHLYHSEGSTSPHSGSYPESAKSNYSGGQNMYFLPNDRTQNIQTAPNSAMNTMSPGYISPGPATAMGGGQFSMGFGSPEPHQHPSYQQQHQRNYPGQQPAQEHPNPPPLKRRPSIVGSTVSGADNQSMKTVTSTTSSEKRRQEKIKANSEVRVRGRGS